MCELHKFLLAQHHHLVEQLAVGLQHDNDSAQGVDGRDLQLARAVAQRGDAHVAIAAILHLVQHKGPVVASGGMVYHHGTVGQREDRDRCIGYGLLGGRVEHPALDHTGMSR